MTMTMRETTLVRLALGAILVLGACDPRSTDTATGSIAIQLVVVPDAPPAPAGAVEGVQAAPAEPADALSHLDSAKVTITGGTYNTTTTLTRNGTTNFTGTVTGIPVASNYTVVVVGYDLNEVDYYARTLNVAVTANQTTTATPTFSSYVPAAPTGLPTSPTAAFRLTATIPTVSAADSYKVELASNSGFNPIAASAFIRTTSAIVTVAAPGTWYLRARSAGTAATGGGRASNAAQFTVVTDQIATTDDPTTGLNLGFFGNTTVNRDSLNIYPAGDFDFFRLSSCNGDSLIVTAQAVRLAAPGSPLNTQLHVYNSAGLFLAQNDNADSTDAVVRIKRAADGVYAVRVSASPTATGTAGNNVGHYRLVTQGKIGSGTINNGSACLVTAMPASSISAGLYHTCAVRPGNITDCWGYNSSGQLGDATTGNATSSPVRTAGSVTLVSTSAGGFHTCGLTSAGAAYCWGNNAVGQLGDGSTNSRTQPNAVQQGGLTFQAGSLTSGLNHTCALAATGATAGTAFCWGGNAQGQLGVGDLTNRMTPISVGSPTVFTNISAGRTHTCGVATNGYTYCWGDDADEQLGPGASGSTYSASPVVLGGLNQYSTVKAGGFHTCALTPGGAAQCWGQGGFGQLGDANFSTSATPATVLGGHAFSQLAAGRFHTCGLQSGVVWCWGANGNGQLGNNDPTLSMVGGNPVQVASASVFTNISAGHYHTCAIQNTGTAQCWGWNGFGQIGNAIAFNHLGPVRVSSAANFSRLSLGHQHTCGLTGTVINCWGLGSNGQLAQGDYGDRLVPVAVGGSWSAIAAGGWHSCGILTGSNTGQCWGWGDAGQLGIGSGGSITTPTTISGGIQWAAISGGDWHSCGISTGNSIYCWGEDFWGALGNGAGGSTNTPSLVSPPGGVTWSSVSAGSYFSCALTSTGAAWCWGDNDYGQLGNNSTAATTSPVAVTMPSGRTFAQLQAGMDFVCARADNGAAYCWGNNNVGQLGTGTAGSSPVTTPQLVTGGLTFIDVSVGRNQGACGITNANRAYCWGGNFTGLLGDGTFVNRTAPTAVNTALSFQKIQISDVHTCAIEVGGTPTAPGNIHCWGNNERGELGNNTRTSVLSPTAVVTGPSTAPPVLVSPVEESGLSPSMVARQALDRREEEKLKHKASRLLLP